MSDEIIFTEAELELEKKIRNLYNSGKIEEALDLSKSFLTDYPNSLKAKHLYSSMHGDYASPAIHPPEEAERLKGIAKAGFEELINHPDFKRLPLGSQHGIKNEYYWFFEMPKEQYELGLEGLKAGEDRSSYSCCVGASMMALKELRNTSLDFSVRIANAVHWAQESLKYYEIFNRYAPDWANINYFSAQAWAVLGEEEKALASFTEMYKKMNTQVDQKEFDEFMKILEEVRDLLAS